MNRAFNRRTPPHQHMAGFEYLHLMIRLGVRSVHVYLLAVECARCGGDHSLSQCKWTLIK